MCRQRLLISALSPRQRSVVFTGVDQQLMHEPTVETRNRKQMRDNPLASWELRLGDLRIYYDVEEQPEQLVKIAVIGIKDAYCGGRYCRVAIHHRRRALS